MKAVEKNLDPKLNSMNYAEKVNKRSQGEIETEVLQFFTQDQKQEN